MKKLFKALLASAFMFTMVGCDDSHSESAQEHYSSSQWSEDRIISEAAKLEEECINAAKAGDYERYAACFDSGNEATVQESFNSFDTSINLSQFDTVDGLVIDQTNGLYYVNIIYYMVSGSHPNTHMESLALADSFKIADNELKKIAKEEDLNQLNEHFLSSDVYPDEVLNAVNSGRNGTMFDPFNFMYLNDSKVFNGHSQAALKFAYQNEDGSVGLVFWFANGTNQNIHYTTGTVSMTDTQLGTILDTSITVDKIVPAHSSIELWYTIPAEYVYTSYAPWGSVQHNVDVQFD